MQNENERLKELDKLFEKAIKLEFGCDRKKLHKMMENSAQKTSDFENKIISFFDLKSTLDMEEFLSVICNETTLNYFNTKKMGNKPNGDR